MTSDAPILAASADGREQADPRRWAALIVLLLAAFMSLLDVSIVNIAIPSIQRGLRASYADVQWALAGYTLAYAIVLITGGRLGDMFGRKRLFLIGVAGFTVMSALCGAAQGPGMLIACRVVQGAMGAIMIPQVLAVIQVSFPPGERIKALAGYGATAGLGTVSGPLIGGLLVTHNVLGLGWRTIFLINVPVGAVAVIAALLFVRESRSPGRTRLDPGGLALLTAAMLLLLYPLVQGRQLGWPAWSFASMAASAPVFGLFAAYELGRSRRGGSPLVEMRMFGRRAFSVGIAIAVTFFLGVASFALVLTLFLQEGLGFSALHAAGTFVPFSLGVLVSSGVAARLAPRLGRTVTMAGALVMAAGMAGLIWTVHQAGPAVTTWQLVPGMAAVGLGMGAVLAPLADILLAGVRRQDAGSASGVLNTGFQIGNSIGLALVGVIFFGLLGSQSGPAVNATAPQIKAALATAGVPAAAQRRIAGQFRACLHDRLVASDPTITPPACRRSPAETMLPAAADHAITAGAVRAVKRDFTAALQRTLWYQVGAFLLAFLLMLALPRRAARSVHDTEPVHDTQALPAKG